MPVVPATVVGVLVFVVGVAAAGAFLWRERRTRREKQGKAEANRRELHEIRKEGERRVAAARMAEELRRAEEVRQMDAANRYARG